jgi:hypothetical protein
VSGIYVNFSDDEANSESRDIEPLPSGGYLVVIDECELAECGPNSKNPGKPYYKLRFNVVADKRGGTFVDRKCWANAMLFSPALFTIVHLLKALGMNVTPGEFEIPEADWFVGKTLMIKGIYVGEQTNKQTGDKYAPKFEPKSFFSESQWNVTAPGAKGGGQKPASSQSSLLS